MEINDKNLIEELEQRNPAAVEFVIDRYGSLLKGVLIRNLGEYADRWEECLNDVLMALWVNPQSFEEKRGQLKNWLCAIAKYKAIDRLRRERRADYGRVKMGDEQWNAIADEMKDFSEDESMEELQRLISCLSPTDRELFVRRYGLQQSAAQISADTGMSRDNIYTRLSRGKKKLRSFWCKNERGEYSE